MKRLAQRVATWWLVGLVEVGAWLLHLPATDEDDPC
jgi:hypothetical protein